MIIGQYSLINVILAAVGVIWPGRIGLWAVFLTSFFMSIIYPTILALATRSLAPHSKLLGSLIVMAIIGGAVFTPIMGLISRTASMAKAVLVPPACYLFIAHISFAAAKKKAVSRAVDLNTLGI